MQKRIILYLPILLIICVAGLLIYIAIPPPVQRVATWYGDPDLRGFDFDNYVIHLRGHVEYAPNVLLSPAEFEAWVNDPSNELSFGWASYHTTATSRIRIYAEDGKWYTFTRYAAEFSRRIYVNGEWLLDIGRPGETPETDIPNTGRITFTAQGADGVIEIIQQSSNHVHRMGGAHLWWYVGTGTLLSDWARAEQYQTAIILGSFLMLALFFFVLFFTHGRNYANLLFSLFCITWFLRMGVTGNRVFTVIFPCMDWFMKFRIEYISIPVSAFLTLAIVNILFKGMLHKKILYGFYAVSGVLAILFIFLDTVVMSNMLPIMLWIYLGAAAWLFVSLVLYWKKINSGHSIFIVGLLLFIVAVLADSGLIVRLFHMPPFHMAGVAVLVFALCEAVAVFIATMREIEEAKKNELEAIVKGQTLAAENAALDILSRSKTEFLEKVSHEMKTPLMVMGGYAQTTERHINENRVNDKTRFYLQTIFLESQRLSDLVTEMLKTSIAKGGHKTDMQTAVADIINKAAAMCQPILDMNKNRLAIDIETNCPDVKANPDMIIQIFFNLVGNANRHMKSDTIHISAKREGQAVLFAVRDNGKGIPSEILPTIFERGISGDDGTGLGLHICKETVEAHGGVITAENTSSGGAIISFTLPIYNEAEQGETT